MKMIEGFAGRRRLGAPPVLAGAVSLVLVATACGGSTSSQPANSASGAKIAEAQQLLHQAEQPITNWQPPGPAFDASKARGKTIFYITNSFSIPFESFMLQGLKEGAATVGATVIGFDSNFSAAQASRGMGEAVQSKADVIMLDAFVPTLLAPAIDQAQKAGIPVLTSNTQESGPMLPGYPPGIVGSQTHPFALPGKDEADFVVQDSKGNANVMYITSSDVPVIADVNKNAFVGELQRLCPACKSQVVDVPTSQWSTLASKTSSFIAANPAVNYYVPVFDGMVIFMVPGVISANAQSRVKIVSFNASPSVMQNLKDKNVVAADAGGPNLLQGWAFADEGFRVLAGQKPLDDLGIPTRIFDASNINTIDLSQQESLWYGPLDYQAKYKKLWGVG